MKVKNSLFLRDLRRAGRDVLVRALISFLMAVFPALLFVCYYYKQDKNSSEPKGLVMTVFILGIFSSFAVSLLENLVSQASVIFQWSPFFYNFFEAFIVAGLCEEYIKLLIVINYVYRKPIFNEVMDGIVYTIVASLGFACMENVLYVMGDTWHTAIARGFTAVPLHAVCSGMMGYYIGRAKFAATRQEEKFLIYKGLWQAVMIHGLYDFLLFISPVIGSVYSVAIVPLIFWTYLKLKKRIQIASQH